MIQLWKYLHGKYDVDTSMFTMDTRGVARDHSLKLVKHRTCCTRIQMRSPSFSQRVVTPWNNLPEEVITANTLPQATLFGTGH